MRLHRSGPMRRLPVLAATLILTATAALAQSTATKKFLMEAIQGNFAEVQMGELAKNNAQSDDVKSFGQMLIDDHGAANQKAMDVAKSLNINAPTGPSARQKADHDKMAKTNGALFDKMFIQHMVTDHQKDIAAYKKASKSSDAVGQYAQQALPTLQTHLETAQKLQKSMGKK